MAEDIKEEPKEDKKVTVSAKTILAMQEQMAAMEQKLADQDAKNAGIEEILAKTAEAGTEPKLREKKNFEPKFRTVRLRKFPIGGDIENQGYIVGWTNRGAYQVVDKSGVSPQIVDMIDVVFLGQERNEEGKIKAEQIRLLDLFNKGQQVHCKILETKREEIKTPTGEEIDVTVFDPAHGLVATGDKIDGFIVNSEIKYKLKVPGVDDEVWIDSVFCN